MRQVTPSQYVELLNEALRRSPDYEPGMRFVLHLDASTDIAPRGFRYEGPASSYLLAAHVQAMVCQGLLVDG